MSGALKVLIPAAGGSRRFVQEGIHHPKGLIRFSYRGNPSTTMIQQITGMHGIRSEDVYVGVSNARISWSVLAPMNLLVVGPTRGQADTILRMLNSIYDDGPVLILNSDVGYLYSLEAFLQKVTGHTMGALVFPSTDRAYSYVDGMPWFQSAEEKNPISPWAMAGAYYFSSRTALADAIRQQIIADDYHNHELFLSGAFKHTYATGIAVPTDKELILNWGTPEDLARDPGVRIDEPFIEDILRRFR